MAGRPIRVKGCRSDKHLRIMLTEKEQELMRRVACGENVSSWARRTLLQAAMLKADRKTRR